MAEDIRGKYSFEICEDCGGRGYISFRNGGDESCGVCEGEGAVYSKITGEGE